MTARVDNGDRITNVVRAYAGWRTLGAGLIGPWFGLAHGLHSLGIVDGNGRAAVILGGVVLTLMLGRYDKMTFGWIRPLPTPDGARAWLWFLAALAGIPALLILWVNAGYGLMELGALLSTGGVILAAFALPTPSTGWLFAAGIWVAALYAELAQAAPLVSGALHVLLAASVVSACIVERRRLSRLFQTVHA